MGLPLLIRLSLGLAGLAGVSTVVGVPIALTSKGNVYTERLLGGGGIIPVSVNKCESLNRDESNSINFGNSEVGSVCGSIEGEDNSINNSNEYTSFFKDRGDDKDKNWNSSENQDRWTKQCIDSNVTSPGAIFEGSAEGVTQYLGLCGNTDVDNTKFVKKKKEGKQSSNKDELTLGICDKECGSPESDSSLGSPRSLQNESKNNGNGKKVKFYKKIQ